MIRPATLRLALAALLLSLSASAFATPRDTLLRAAFATYDKGQATALVGQALAETQATLAAHPADREARLQRALATGYRGQLRRSPADAKAARAMLETLVADYPGDAEVQVAYAGWHLTAISDLGPFLAGTLLGADKDKGFAALSRALVLGGNRAFFPAYAALIRIRVTPGDTRTPLTFAERALAAPAPQPIDRVLQRAVQKVIVPLRAGDGRAAAGLAKRLLPFGSVD